MGLSYNQIVRFMKKIAIIAGGYSSESVISIKSAKEVLANLNKTDYQPYVIVIHPDGWYYESTDGTRIDIDRGDFTLVKNGEKISFDVIFMAIHGAPGENGVLQSYFDLLDIPYTSCGAFVSHLTFNKFATKAFLNDYGVPGADAYLFRKHAELNADEVISKTALPCFVKPNNGGSSFGITKVKSREELAKAIDLALKEDDEVIIEKFIKGRELTCGVFTRNDKQIALPVTEVISKNEFFDYEAKYTVGKSDEVTPANIPDDVRDRCQQLAKEIYRNLDCRGVVRIDFIFSEDLFYLLEVNTVPGMSPESIIPQQAKSAGYTLPEFYTILIEQAIRNRLRV